MEDYINPFQFDVDKQRLICLSYGVLVPDKVAESLLSIEEIDVKQHEYFLEKQIQSNPSFHLPIKQSVRVQEHGKDDILEEWQKSGRSKQGYFAKAI